MHTVGASRIFRGFSSRGVDAREKASTLMTTLVSEAISTGRTYPPVRAAIKNHAYPWPAFISRRAGAEA